MGRRTRARAARPAPQPAAVPVATPREDALPRVPRWAVPLALAIVVCALFGDVLLGPAGRLAAGPTTDLHEQFGFYRDFAFGELRRGRLPLWNPHILSGTPAAGDFQSALFYPLNVVYLLLPLGRALDLDLVLSILAAALLAALWAHRRGFHPLACLTSGAVYALGAPVFFKVYAGHLAPLASMCWVPLVLMCVFDLWGERPWRAALVGGVGVALQVTGGHPQTVFFTGVAAVLCLLLRLLDRPRPLRVLPAFVLMYATGVALSAVQLFTGMQAASETTRGAGVPRWFASHFSLPPENLVTFLAPRFFGAQTEHLYWGRCYLWEVSLFIGVLGLALAVHGAREGALPEKRAALLALPALLLLALGARTPLFDLLYGNVPGFDHFRGWCKFIVEGSALLSLLAGAGADALLRSDRGARAAARGLLAVTLLAGAGATYVRVLSAEDWAGVLKQVADTRETYLPDADRTRPGFAENARDTSAASLALAAATAAVGALLFAWRRRSPRAAQALVALVVVELAAHAAATRGHFDLADVAFPEIRAHVAAHPGDERVFNTLLPNSAMSTGALDIWGYNPIVLGRYAEFVAFTQGQDPDTATMYVTFNRWSPLFRLLRCRWLVQQDASKGTTVRDMGAGLPHALLVGEARVITGADDRARRNAVLAVLGAADFDPRRTVVLETAPIPAPAGTAGGSATVVSTGTDEMTVEADAPAPAVLLLTDSYSAAWQAEGLPGSAQAAYAIQPADHALMAIPLGAGHHRIHLAYRPRAFRAGAAVSAIALALVALGFAWEARRG